MLGCCGGSAGTDSPPRRPPGLGAAPATYARRSREAIDVGQAWAAVNAGDHARLKFVLGTVSEADSTRLVDHNKQTPLHKACSYFFHQCVEVLLEAGLNPGATDQDGVTPLLSFMRAAVAQPAAPATPKEDQQRKTAALLLRLDSRVQWLDRADKTKKETPLLVAARAACAHYVTALVDAGASLLPVDDQGANVLHLVARCSQPESASALSCLATLLQAATQAGVLRDLMAANMTGTLGASPLHAAVSAPALLQKMLECKSAFDLHVLNSQRQNALHLALQAAIGGHAPAIAAAVNLVSAGIDISAVSARGTTPIQLAVDLGCHQPAPEGGAVLRAMAAGKGKVVTMAGQGNVWDQRGLCGFAAVHMAARRLDGDMLVGLVQKRGAAVDARDAEGNTAAIIAALQGGEGSKDVLLRLFGDMAADPLCLGPLPAGNSAAWLLLLTFSKQPDAQLELLESVMDVIRLEDPTRVHSATATHTAHPAVPGPQPLLHAAAAQGMIGVVRALRLMHQLPLTTANGAGDTPLHVAVMAHCHGVTSGGTAVVAFLLEQGADPTVTNAAGRHPLGLAVAEGELELALTMVRANKACVHLATPTGKSTMALAVQLGKIAAIKELVGLGSEVGHGLHTALAHGHVEVVQLLLTYPGAQATLDEPDAGGVRPLSYAWLGPRASPLEPCPLSKRTEAEVLRLVALLCEAGATAQFLDTSGLTPLAHAVACRHVRVVTQLALREPHLDPNLRGKAGQTPLGIAGLVGDLESIKALVTGFKKLDVHVTIPLSPRPLSLLHLAIIRGDVDVTTYLLQLPTVRVDQAAFHLALAQLKDNPDVAEALVGALLAPQHLSTSLGALDLSKAVNLALPLLTPPGVTPPATPRAVTSGGVSPGGMIPGGVSPRGVSAGYVTAVVTGVVVAVPTLPPLHLAALHGHTAIMELLLTRAGADVDGPAPDGSTALHVAVVANAMKAVAVLVAAGAAVAAPSAAHNQACPLQLAMAQHDPNMLRMLLSSTKLFDINHPDADGRTTFNEAMTGHVAVAKRPGGEHTALNEDTTGLLRECAHQPPPKDNQRGTWGILSPAGRSIADCVVMLIQAGADVDQPLVASGRDDGDVRVGGQPALVAALHLQAGPACALLVRNKRDILVNADITTGRVAALAVAGQVVEEAYTQLRAITPEEPAAVAKPKGISSLINIFVAAPKPRDPLVERAVQDQTLLLERACAITRLLLEVSDIDLCIPVTAHGGNILALLSGISSPYGYKQVASLLVGSSRVTEQLLNAQFGPNQQTVLHMAVARNDAPLVALLAAQPAINYNLVDRLGLTPLACAVHSGSTLALQRLLEVARPNTLAFTPLDVCCYGPDKKNITKSPMALAVALPQTELLRALLAAVAGGPVVRKRDGASTGGAARPFEDPRSLSGLPPGASAASASSLTPFSNISTFPSGITEGSTTGGVDALTRLRAKTSGPAGSDSSNPMTPAASGALGRTSGGAGSFMGASKPSVAMSTSLGGEGGSIQQPVVQMVYAFELQQALESPVDREERQPLQVALLARKLDHAELLVNYGASLAVQEPEGCPDWELDVRLHTPMHLALLHLAAVQAKKPKQAKEVEKARDLALLMSLQPSMADAILMADVQGMTVLHWAATQAHPCAKELVTQLVAVARVAGCLDWTTKDKVSALHACAMANALDMAKALLTAGASTTLLNRSGQRVIDLASDKMKKLLEAPPPIQLTQPLRPYVPKLIGILNQANNSNRVLAVLGGMSQAARENWDAFMGPTLDLSEPEEEERMTAEQAMLNVVGRQTTSALYAGFKMALSALQESASAIPLVGAGVVLIMKVTSDLLVKAELVVVNNMLVTHICNRVRLLEKDLTRLHAACSGDHPRGEEFTAIIFPHIKNLATHLLEVYKQVGEWSEQSAQALVFRMLAAVDANTDFVFLNTQLSDYINGLNYAVSMTTLLGGAGMVPVDTKAVMAELEKAKRQDMQDAVRHLLDEDVNATLSHADLVKLYNEHGLDYRALKSKERQRFRQSTVRDLQISKTKVVTVGEPMRGSLTHVYAGKWDGVPVAVKRLPAAELGDPRLRATLQLAVENEAYVMSTIHHPNVGCVYGCVIEGDYLALITPMYNQGSLHKLIYDPGLNILPVQMMGIAIQVARGMVYLHSRREPILHGDLTTKNIMFAADGNAVITDFRSAQINAATSTLSSASKRSPAEAVSAALYSAPEEWSDPDFRITKQSDVWSYGILLSELLCRKLPEIPGCVMTHHAYTEAITKEKKVPQLPKAVHGSIIATLVKACCAFDPTGRPTFVQIADNLEKALEAMEVQSFALGGDDSD